MGHYQQTPSLLYKNNTLENCSVHAIRLKLTRRNQARATHINMTAKPAWWSWSLEADVFASCFVAVATGVSHINFTYHYLRDGNIYNFVAVDNATSSASLWWAIRVLDAYCVGLQYIVFSKLPLSPLEGNPVFTFSGMSFLSNQNDLTHGHDLYLESYFFITSNGRIFNDLPTSVFNNRTWGFSPAAP